MRIPDDIIEKIRSSVSIEDIIGEFVPLKRRGRNFVGLCPFHSEKTPSFNVNPDRQIFHCFGCGAGGNVFTFLSRINNQTFPESVKFLAERLNIAIPQQGGPTDEFEVEREAIYKVNEKAAYVFNYYLQHREEGRQHREYLKSRNISEETIVKFQLGAAPDFWDKLVSELKNLKFSDEIMEKAGLVRRRQTGDGVYDAFRNRLMIPIYDVSNHIIAFGGRILPAAKDVPAPEYDAPKYLNSPETLVFHKSDTLFGLNLSRNFIREEDEAVLVEGYFDVMMLYQKGVRNVVAPLGTAFTQGHITILRRYSRNITLVFDPDTAGENATWRTIEMLLSHEFHIKILRLPFDMDPFDYLNNHSEESFRKLKEEAPDVFTYMVRFLRDKFDPNSMMGKLKMLSYIFKYMVRIVSPVELDLVYSLLAQDLSVSVESLKFEFERFKKDRRNFIPEKAVPATAVPAAPKPLTKDFFRRKMELEFLVLLLLQNSRIPEAQGLFTPDDFSDPLARSMYEKILALHAESPGFTVDDFFNRINDTDMNSAVTEIMFSERFRNPAKIPDKERARADEVFREELYVDYRDKLHIKKMDTLRQVLKERYKEAETSGDLPAMQEYQKALSAADETRRALNKNQTALEKGNK
jgi:DNA primase